MTLKDLKKRVKDENKVITINDDKGWANIDFIEETKGEIKIKIDTNMPFDDYMNKEENKKFKEIFDKATNRLLDTLNNNPNELFDIKKLSKQLAEKSQQIYNLTIENRNLKSKIDRQEQIIREAKELCRERIDFINAEYDDSFECCVEELGNVLKILDRNINDGV